MGKQRLDGRDAVKARGLVADINNNPDSQDVCLRALRKITGMTRSKLGSWQAIDGLPGGQTALSILKQHGVKPPR